MVYCMLCCTYIVCVGDGEVSDGDTRVRLDLSSSFHQERTVMVTRGFECPVLVTRLLETITVTDRK